MRENLKLRLLNARLALLSRNEAAFRNDLTTAQEMLAKYFDTRAAHDPGGAGAAAPGAGQQPGDRDADLADSLNAVRNYKAKP